MFKEIRRDCAASGARAPLSGPPTALTLTTQHLSRCPVAPRPRNAAAFNYLLIRSENPGEVPTPAA